MLFVIKKETNNILRARVERGLWRHKSENHVNCNLARHLHKAERVKSWRQRRTDIATSYKRMMDWYFVLWQKGWDVWNLKRTIISIKIKSQFELFYDVNLECESKINVGRTWRNKKESRHVETAFFTNSSIHSLH